MRCVVTSYFKTDRGQWYQPGMAQDFTEDEMDRYGQHLKKIQTASIEPPETRAPRGRRKGGDK